MVVKAPVLVIQYDQKCPLEYSFIGMKSVENLSHE